MGNLITKYTTNNVQLNESNVSDVVNAEQVVKTPTASGAATTRTGLLKNLWNFDPRSPSTFISRTPITMFRKNSASKFNHQELNESVESQVDLDILTPEEQDSLDSNEDLAKNPVVEELLDPRSPVIGSEFIRTPIIPFEEIKKKKEDNLVKKLTEKLISTAISNDDDKYCEDKMSIKKAKKNKNLIYEDEDAEDDHLSTPPKKVAISTVLTSSRTPLSCVANTTPKARNFIPTTSTPKSKFPFTDENQKSVSRIPVSARRLH